MQKPQLSIVIVSRDMNDYLRECVNHCLNNSLKSIEIIIVLDQITDIKFPKTRIYCTGQQGPARKRDFGAKKAVADIIAFIDDDAYPSRRWAEYIVKTIKTTDVAAVGGPGVTPPGVGWREEASGWASASPLGSAQYIYRFLPMAKRYVDDYPSMNLAVRRDEFMAIGGFDSHYYPGEDTKLCLDFAYKRHKRILYHPLIQVFHHRRPILSQHLRQNGNYGLHRGFFVKILPRTSFRLSYFIPSMFSFLVIALAMTVAILGYKNSLFLRWGIFLQAELALYSIYWALLAANAVWILRKSGKVQMAIVSLVVIQLTHFWYGIRFLQGLLFTSRLKN